jgi:hypothetical protein
MALAFVKNYTYDLYGEYEVFDNNNGSYEFVKPPNSKYIGGVDRVTIPYGEVELGKGDFESVTPNKIQKRPVAAAAGRRRRMTKKSKRRARKTRRRV